MAGLIEELRSKPHGNANPISSFWVCEAALSVIAAAPINR